MVTFRNIVYVLAMEIPELISSFLILWGIFQCKLKKRFLPYGEAYVCLLLVLVFTVLTGNVNNLPPICVILEFLIVFLCFEERFTKKIVLYFTAYISSYIINTIIRILFSIIFYKKDISLTELSYEELIRFRFIMLTLNIGILLIIIFSIRKWKKQIANWLNNISLSYVAIALPGLLCCAVVLAFVQISRNYSLNMIWDKVAGICVTIVCIFFMAGTVAFIFINDSRKHYQMENQLKERFLHMQNSYYKNILESDKEIRKFRHDIRGHMGCMRILAEEGKYQELSGYIGEVFYEVDNLLNRNYASGNDFVDATLNYLGTEAKKDGIAIALEGVLPNTLKIAGSDLCTIFFNTVSNGIEACRFVREKEKRNISISILCNQNILIIVIENPVIEPVDMNILGRGTTKPDKIHHGYGIQSIKDTVKKYDGEVKFINEGGKFRVEAILLNII